MVTTMLSCELTSIRSELPSCLELSELTKYKSFGSHFQAFHESEVLVQTTVNSNKLKRARI